MRTAVSHDTHEVIYYGLVPGDIPAARRGNGDPQRLTGYDFGDAGKSPRHRYEERVTERDEWQGLQGRL